MPVGGFGRFPEECGEIDRTFGRTGRRDLAVGAGAEKFLEFFLGVVSKRP
jgi:hypothetical protein